jgi:hypothetical protein
MHLANLAANKKKKDKGCGRKAKRQSKAQSQAPQDRNQESGI